MKKISLTILLLATLVLLWTLFKPLDQKPEPAEFTCLDLDLGQFTTLPELSGTVYGVGLSYAGHIEETASDFTPKAAPPLFIKHSSSILRGGGVVLIPDSKGLTNALDALEGGLGERVITAHPNLPAMLDYEVELAYILLEDIDKSKLNDDGFTPKLGFTVLNDLSARSLILLGEGQANRYDYWGLSKSFLGFTPISNKLWVPNTHSKNSIPCVTLLTTVNGELRQSQSTQNMIYTPLEMFRFIAEKYPNRKFKTGDVVATGTPGGVIMKAPRWKVRLSSLLNLDRFTKLNAVVGQTGFLQVGDKIITSAEGLASVEVTLK